MSVNTNRNLWLQVIFHKFKEWFHILGLIFLGVTLVKLFNFLAVYYFVLGFFLLLFAHSLDDKKLFSSFFSFSGIILLSIVHVNSFQILIVTSIMLLCVLYKVVKKYPFSAFYKGFGYSLLFLLPLNSFNFFYFPISFLATISEIFHEAEHFEQDKKEGRFTTAHLLNFKISKEGRRKWKLILIIIGSGLFLYFYFL